MVTENRKFAVYSSSKQLLSAALSLPEDKRSQFLFESIQ